MPRPRRGSCPAAALPPTLAFQDEGSAERRTNQPLESTHGSPVGPAITRPPPLRAILTPGHWPLTMAMLSGGATRSPCCTAREPVGSYSTPASMISESKAVPRSSSRSDGSFQADGQRIGFHRPLIFPIILSTSSRYRCNAGRFKGREAAAFLLDEIVLDAPDGFSRIEDRLPGRNTFSKQNAVPLSGPGAQSLQ